jgi:hypothetical protein
MKHRVYVLDGQPVSVRTLCADRQWPRDVVTQALRESDALTTDQLRQIVVASKQKPRVISVPEANRKRNQVCADRYLTKQARTATLRFGRAH